MDETKEANDYLIIIQSARWNVWCGLGLLSTSNTTNGRPQLSRVFFVGPTTFLKVLIFRPPVQVGGSVKKSFDTLRTNQSRQTDKLSDACTVFGAHGSDEVNQMSSKGSLSFCLVGF